MARALAAARLGFRRLFSISAFTPPPAAAPPPKAEPSTNLFVSGLSKRTTSEGLREAFSKFGEIVHAKVVTDRVSGYSKGFGFVRYASIEEASEGIKGMDGKFLDGWVIFAEYARPRPPPSQDQPSQPQSNYGSAPFSQSNAYYTSAATSNYSSQTSSPPPSQPQSNYGSAPLSQSTPYYTSAATSNYLSQASSPPPPPPPQSNYGSAPLSQSSSFYTSAATSNYSSPPPQPQNSYYSPQATQPPLSNSYYETQTTQPPQSYGGSVQSQSGYASSYLNHSNGSMPPFNHSSEMSQQTSNSSTMHSWYSSQTTQPASHYESAPAVNYSSAAPHQTNNYTTQNSDPASGYTPTQNNSARNCETFEPSPELRSDYESGRAANY
ncbi:serine/arginine-rich splicing factor 2-like [Phalaenopsis equestris]|uniref:serine/arginine-rich splicing factor 2-like n=1 Tax=Phalaenopsis equestris TaxID=78828 RepID=UPI0009E1AC3C|nr:serine/arginine-rich splicing factor 2-like [Phalaenopsis equestris]